MKKLHKKEIQKYFSEKILNTIYKQKNNRGVCLEIMKKMNAMSPDTPERAENRCVTGVLVYKKIFSRKYVVILQRKTKHVQPVRVPYKKIIYKLKTKNIMKTTTKNAQQSAKKESKQNLVIATKYNVRLADHMKDAHSPSKAVKNAFETAKLNEKYFAAVAAIFMDENGKTIQARQKEVITYLCGRYKGTPKKGYSEYYVHQYFEKRIKESAYKVAACWNYLANEINSK